MKNYILSVGFICLLSCSKTYTVDDFPAAIRERINSFEKSALCADAHVDEYFFRKENVYVFENGTCGADLISAVYSEQGEEMGSLGGISGNTQVNGQPFGDATFIRTIWKKEQ